MHQSATGHHLSAYNGHVVTDMGVKPQAGLARSSVVPVEDNYALAVKNNTLVTQQKSKGENLMLEGLLTF